MAKQNSLNNYSDNNYILRATGVAGITLNWSARLQYEFVS